MSEYWVSKKKYFCKYCEIFIADDVPSRQHHENGLRHKGNMERYIRGIYKTGEKKKKDQEEEKRDMARVEQAAQAAFAQDVSSGHARATSAPTASTSSGPRKPATKPSNPFANYSTAAQLGFTDPDAEELGIRKSQGVVGEWRIVESTPAPLSGEVEADFKPQNLTGVEEAVAATGVAESGAKRLAEALPEDDTRTFKLRKKTTTVGLGEIYDPGLIPIKLKKRKEETPPTNEASTLATNSASSGTTSALTGEVPKWTAISLKPKDTTVSLPEVTSSLPHSGSEVSPPATSRWAKVQWGQPLKKEEAAAAFSEQPSENTSTGATLTEPVVKPEEDVTLTMKAESIDSSLPPEPEPPTAGLFKKRKTPAGAGRGRKQI